MTRRVSLCLALLALSFAPVALAQDVDKTPAPTPEAATPKPPNTRIRVGGNVMQAQLLRQVTPVYPPLAKAGHISGTVVLHAIVAKDGTIEQLEYVSGPAILMGSALEAVKQWVYKPNMLNGAPVEVDTQISVNYVLGSDKAATPGSSTTPQPAIDPKLKSDLLRIMELSNYRLRAAELGRVIFESMRPLRYRSFP